MSRLTGVLALSEASTHDFERRALIRGLRQQLESLARAGVDRVPAAPPFEPSLDWVHSPGAAPAPPRESRDRSDQPIDPARLDSPALLTRPAPASAAPAVIPRPEPLIAVPPATISPIPTTSPFAAMPSLFDTNGFDTPVVPPENRQPLLQALAAEVAACCKCPYLAETRTQTVFGVGPPVTRLMFVGEAPGADEDRLGEPFVGRAGQLLTDMITKGMGLAREEVYIANVLKCRPPENRTPALEECANCGPYLDQQIAVIRPEFLCLLGRVAVQYVLKTSLAMGRLRGKWHRYRGIPTIATYHPAYLLRNPASKKEAWEDLQMLMKAMGLRAPARSRTDGT